MCFVAAHQQKENRSESTRWVIRNNRSVEHGSAENAQARLQPSFHLDGVGCAPLAGGARWAWHAPLGSPRLHLQNQDAGSSSPHLVSIEINQKTHSFELHNLRKEDSTLPFRTSLVVHQPAIILQKQVADGRKSFASDLGGSAAAFERGGRMERLFAYSCHAMGTP